MKTNDIGVKPAERRVLLFAEMLINKTLKFVLIEIDIKNIKAIMEHMNNRSHIIYYYLHIIQP